MPRRASARICSIRAATRPAKSCRYCARPAATSPKPLALEEGDNVIHLRTLRRVNGVALCLIDHYFTDLRFWPTLQTFTQGSLHDFLRQRLDVELTRARTRPMPVASPGQREQYSWDPQHGAAAVRENPEPPRGRTAGYGIPVSLTRADMIEFTMEH